MQQPVAGVDPSGTLGSLELSLLESTRERGIAGAIGDDTREGDCSF